MQKSPLRGMKVALNDKRHQEKMCSDSLFSHLRFQTNLRQTYFLSITLDPPERSDHDCHGLPQLEPMRAHKGAATYLTDHWLLLKLTLDIGQKPTFQYSLISITLVSSRVWFTPTTTDFALMEKMQFSSNKQAGQACQVKCIREQLHEIASTKQGYLMAANYFCLQPCKASTWTTTCWFVVYEKTFFQVLGWK